MQMILVSVEQAIKIPRTPPGPSYVPKSSQSEKSYSRVASTKYMLLVLQDDLTKQQESLFLLQKLSKSLTDEVVDRHVQDLQKKYLDFLKETESQYKHTIKELIQQKLQNPSSMHLYKIK